VTAGLPGGPVSRLPGTGAVAGTRIRRSRNPPGVPGPARPSHAGDGARPARARRGPAVGRGDPAGARRVCPCRF
jgi:hypothetical protein